MDKAADMIAHPAVALARAAAMLACAGVLAGCGSINGFLGGSSAEDALKQLKWTYAADGVRIAVRADPALNRSEDQPHSLAITVVQMEDPTAFAPYAKSSAKIKQLLLADEPPAGMLALQRLFISPGEVRTITSPRMEQAQYVGLVSGYFHLDADRTVRLYRIGVEIDASGIIVKNRNASPEPLKIDLRLGPDGILDAPGTRTPPIAPTQPKAGRIPPAGDSSAAPTKH